MIRAWHIHAGEPCEASLLIYAEGRGRAKSLAMSAGLWDYDQFVHIHATRIPAFDGFFTAECVVETNEELPLGAPSFYYDEEW